MGDKAWEQWGAACGQSLNEVPSRPSPCVCTKGCVPGDTQLGGELPKGKKFLSWCCSADPLGSGEEARPYSSSSGLWDQLQAWQVCGVGEGGSCEKVGHRRLRDWI